MAVRRLSWRIRRALLVAVLSLAVSGSASAVEVVVSDAGEEAAPVQGAVVSLWAFDEKGAPRFVARTNSDEGGVAALSGRTPEGGALVVWADGRLRQELRFPDALPDRVEVNLEAGERKIVRVRDERGKPITHFRIAVFPADRLSLSTIAAMNSSGRFDGAGGVLGSVAAAEMEMRLEGFEVRTVESEKGEVIVGGLEEGEYQLFVGAPRFGTATETFSTSREGTLTLTLDRGTCRRTRVVDRRNGDPVEGAFAAPAPAFVQGPFAKLWPAWPSGLEGELSYGCPRRQIGLRAARVIAAPGYAPLALDGEAPGPEVALGPGARIVGSALEDGEIPLADHLVVAEAGGFEWRTKVDVSGEFALAGLPAGSVDLQLFDPTEEQWVVGTRLALEPDETRQVALGPGGRVRVQILRAGEPWPDLAVVLVAGAETEPVIVAQCESDEQGWCALPVPEGYEGRLSLTVSDGRQILSVPMPEKGTMARLREKLFAEEEEQTITVDIPGRWIEGRVIDDASEEGLPSHSVEIRTSGKCQGMVAGADSPLAVEAMEGLILICSGTAVATATDREGEFRLFAPKEGRTLSVGAPFLPHDGPEYEPYSREVKAIPPDEALEIRLRSTGVVEVRVSDSAGKVPESCTVIWRLADFGPSTNRGSSRCEEDGSARLNPPPNKPVLFVAEAPGSALALEGPLLLAPRDRKTVQLTLHPSGTVRIRSTDFPRHEGRPYVERGTLMDAAGRDWTMVAFPRFMPGANEVVFDRLPPGNWVVKIGNERRKVRLRAGQEMLVDLDE